MITYVFGSYMLMPKLYLVYVNGASGIEAQVMQNYMYMFMHLLKPFVMCDTLFRSRGGLSQAEQFRICAGTSRWL